MCSTFTPCCCALLFTITHCCFVLLLIVTSCCSPHLAIHHCTCCSPSHLVVHFMPNYLFLRLVVCLLFFQVPLATPPSPPRPPLLLCYLVARLCSLLLCLFMSIGIPSPLSCAHGKVWNNINKFHSTS
jgi:hypothetical protein